MANVVSYSQLMAEDEDDAFHRLKQLNSSAITPSTARNHGLIVKWTGDGFIATFDSAVDAVRAAVEIQSAIAAAAAGATETRQMRLRIGISAGDVITVPGNVFGDTVNVAARLQKLAAPGHICISRAIRDAVRGKFAIEYEDRSDVDLENVADPVGAFRVIFDPVAWTMKSETASTKPIRAVRLSVLGGAALLALGAAGAIWLLPHDGSAEAVARPPVLDKKLAAPPTETASLAPPAVAVAAPASLPPALAERLSSALDQALPGLGDVEIKKVVGAYEAATSHKAEAASLQPRGFWRSANRPTSEDAATSALENCQIFYGSPCALVAIDDTILQVEPGENWPVHDMPRVRYSGEFNPLLIPGIRADFRERADITGYHAAPGPKAAAFHPTGGRLFTVITAANQRTAEEGALRACNSDPERNGKDGPCFLYAIGNEIVLSRRLTEPMTAPGR